MLKKVLMDWQPAAKPGPEQDALGFAFVRRIGMEPLLLWVKPDDFGCNALCSKRNCLGCSKCGSLEWNFKTEMIATLYTLFCKFTSASTAQLTSMTSQASSCAYNSM